MRPEPWPGDMLGARHLDALADAIIDISSRIVLSDGDDDHLKFSFASQRWRNAETISIIPSPTYSPYKHPATRKPSDPGTKDAIYLQAILADKREIRIIRDQDHTVRMM